MGLKPVPDGLASGDETTGGRSPEGCDWHDKQTGGARKHRRRKICKRKSCPGALPEGTRHRRGKGVDRSTGRLAGTRSGQFAPARGGPEEAIGA